MTTTSESTLRQPGTAAGAGRGRWIMLAVLLAGQFMALLDVTIVNVALPAIQRDLHFSQGNLTWVVNAFLVTFGSLLLLAGRLGDLAGRKRVFLVGVTTFTVASLLCGIAPNAPVLVVARALQGIAGALLVPSSLALIISSFSEETQGNAIGTWKSPWSEWGRLSAESNGRVECRAAHKWGLPSTLGVPGKSSSRVPAR